MQLQLNSTTCLYTAVICSAMADSQPACVTTMVLIWSNQDQKHKTAKLTQLNICNLMKRQRLHTQSINQQHSVLKPRVRHTLMPTCLTEDFCLFVHSVVPYTNDNNINNQKFQLGQPCKPSPALLCIPVKLGQCLAAGSQYGESSLSLLRQARACSAAVPFPSSPPASGAETG